MRDYSVVVIGAGHAGVEAALAAARLGEKTALFTINLDAIANMPCNPSIGGTAKGHLVREIDALGGEMAKAADKTFLQSRMLNRGKGPAVHSLRVQSDRVKYHQEMKHRVEKEPNIDIIQAEIVEILFDGDRAVGVVTSLKERYTAKAIIIASGTYLKSGKAEVPKEELRHVSNSTISSMTAKALGMSGSFTDIQMYSAAKMSGAEEYDFFLGGAQTIVTIENPSVQNGRELVIFRDSFGSSIAPLIAQGYSKTTLVDIRYVVPDMLPNFVNFENCDVLFLYSSNILNNGRILKNFMR